MPRIPTCSDIYHRAKGRRGRSLCGKISLAVCGDSDPLVRAVPCRTVANTLSIGLVVRRWTQCSSSRSLMRQSKTPAFCTVFLGDGLECKLRRRPMWDDPDTLQMRGSPVDQRPRTTIQTRLNEAQYKGLRNG